MNQFKLRLLFLSLLLVAGAVAVIVRLFSIQVLHGKEYAAQSRLQSHQRCILPAERGSIYDRGGRILAASTVKDVSLTEDVFSAYNTRTNKRALLKRVYPLGKAEGPLIGYIGRDGYGLGGIEFAFDTYLRGEDGWAIVQKDGRNHRYRKIGLPYKEPRRGGDVYLTIDAEIQKIAYSVLRGAVERQGARGGMCMVMDPSSGAILAMVNEPSFDPNSPSAYPLIQRLNTCVSAIYEPGSTFKLITAAAALQDNIVKESDVFDGNNGVYVIRGETIRDHHPYGRLTFVQAISKSSNVCFAKVAGKVGSKRLYRYARDFGFGTRTGIECPGEENGILHPVRDWSGRTLATMAIGQEVSTTFLQMMLAYAAVANGGVLVKPQLCTKMMASDGTATETPDCSPVRRIISERNASRLRHLLKTVVDSGTGARAAISGISVAGKTGTAQKIDSAGYSKTASWASFIGFLPVENPQLLCGILIDEPAGNLMGGTAAAPVFKKVVTQIVSHPGLEFAEKILHERIVPAEKKPKDQETGIIASLIPGQNSGSEKKEAPFCVSRTNAAPGNSGVVPGRVPNCLGKDARDAVNMVNLSGMKPFLKGSGTVHRQVPPPGGLTASVAACTLFCSWGG
ncbi:MAG: hypothetical protein JW768_15955 [Chitinispirillaceae bacterium]|nr:hypothetical protein [Chitinispirillaceae bacterium]